MLCLECSANVNLFFDRPTTSGTESLWGVTCHLVAEWLSDVFLIVFPTLMEVYCTDE